MEELLYSGQVVKAVALGATLERGRGSNPLDSELAVFLVRSNG